MSSSRQSTALPPAAEIPSRRATDHEERWSDVELARLRQEFNAHRDEARAHIAREEQKWDLVLKAFPEGDVDGHRRFHEAKIRAAEAEERFYNALRLELAKKGIWSALTIVLGLIGIGLAVKLGIKAIP